MTFKEALWLTLASMATGMVLGLFSILKSPYTALTSLVAIAITVYYFRHFERKGLRIGYIMLTVLYFILFVFTISVYKFNLTLSSPSV